MLSCGERRTAPSLLDFYRNIQKVRHTFIQKQFRTSPQIQGRDCRLRALSSDGVDILHDFWLARGVNDHAHRSELIDYGCDQLESTLAAQEGRLVRSRRLLVVYHASSSLTFLQPTVCCLISYSHAPALVCRV